MLDNNKKIVLGGIVSLIPLILMFIIEPNELIVFIIFFGIYLILSALFDKLKKRKTKKNKEK